MEPIGLTFKKDGELMIIHKCLSCQKLSNNRIAGDDISDIILTLVQKDDDIGLIREALFGKI
jgi:hypothetical protein